MGPRDTPPEGTRLTEEELVESGGLDDGDLSESEREELLGDDDD